MAPLAAISGGLADAIESVLATRGTQFDRAVAACKVYAKYRQDKVRSYPPGTASVDALRSWCSRYKMGSVLYNMPATEVKRAAHVAGLKIVSNGMPVGTCRSKESADLIPGTSARPRPTSAVASPPETTALDVAFAEDDKQLIPQSTDALRTSAITINGVVTCTPGCAINIDATDCSIQIVAVKGRITEINFL